VTTTCVCRALAFLAIGFSLASGQTLNVKPGQWETTMNSSGAPALAALPPGVLDKMTPDQRAKMEAAMKAAGQARSNVTSSCVTKEDIAKGFQPAEMRDTCKYTVTTSTSSQIRMDMACETDKSKITGAVQIDAMDSEHVKGSVQTQMQFGPAQAKGQAVNNTMTFTSKWVGPVCTEKNSGK